MSKKTIQPCNFLTAKYGTEGSRMARATANQATGDGNSATPTAPATPTSPATPRPLDVALPVRWRSLCVLPPCRIVGPIPWRARSRRSLGFRRISTSSERTGRLAHQSVVSGRLRTNVDPAGRPGSRPPAIDAPDAARSESDRTDCSCHPDHEMWPPGVPSLSLQQPQAMMLDPMQASTTRWGGTE